MSRTQHPLGRPCSLSYGRPTHAPQARRESGPPKGSVNLADSFDVITNSLSVDYMTSPLELFDEMHRVLKPGGVACMAFTNRCFPTKACARAHFTSCLKRARYRPAPS